MMCFKLVCKFRLYGIVRQTYFNKELLYFVPAFWLKNSNVNN
jgi:hypothetical protein